MRHLGLALLVQLGLAGSALAADPVAALIDRARADCESFENGTFEPGDALVEVDLDGAAPVDHILDESRYSCSSAASMYCGSGGCMIHAIIGDRVWDYQAEGWQRIDWDGLPILLVARDGGWCGGIGAQLCVEAVVWSQGEMLTVMPPAPN